MTRCPFLVILYTQQNTGDIMIIINEQQARLVNLGGKGGKEALLKKVFEGIDRKK